MAKKIGRARSSVTETLSLLNIPEALRKKCVENGVTSKSLLLQIARQPTEKKMIEMFQRILQGGLTRDEARRERREEQNGPQRPQPFIFHFEPQNDAFKFRIQFKKSHVSRDELISTLREILSQLEGTAIANPRTRTPRRRRPHPSGTVPQYESGAGLRLRTRFAFPGFPRQTKNL